MSSTVLSQGFIAVLDVPLDSEAREDLQERLYENKSTLHINHEGTLVYSNVVPFKDREDIYELQIGGKTLFDGSINFAHECANAGIVINGTYGSKPYSEIWYNGGDSQVSMLTLEEFLKA